MFPKGGNVFGNGNQPNGSRGMLDISSFMSSIHNQPTIRQALNQSRKKIHYTNYKSIYNVQNLNNLNKTIRIKL